MRTLLGIVPVAIFLAVAAHTCFQVGLQPDDQGYVALRVAENFRSGQGLIFNPGDRRDLVDSPLWVLALSLLSFSSFAPLLIQILGLLFGVAGLLVVVGGARSPLVGAGAALFAAVDGLFVAHAMAGGSEPLAALHVVLLYPILRAARGRSQASRAAHVALAVWAALATAVRYELVLFALPVALAAGLREPQQRHAWLPLVAGCAGAAFFLGLRWSYFGGSPAYWEPWPPTAASVAQAGRDLVMLVLRRPLLLFGLAVMVSDWMRGQLWLGRRIGLAQGLVALLAFSLLPARGAEVHRQVAPLLPLAYLMAVETVWRSARTRPAVIAALLLIVAQPGWTASKRRSDPEAVGAYVRLGQWLRDHTLPGTVVGAGRAGALGYHSRLRVEDVSGRVSSRMAAARRAFAPNAQADAQEAFQSMFRQEPDIVLILPGNPVPSAQIYVPNDDAVPEAIRGPFRVYRWAGSPVWREPPGAAAEGRQQAGSL